MVSNLCTLGGTERVTYLLSKELSAFYECSVITFWNNGDEKYVLASDVKNFNLYERPSRLRYIFFDAVKKISKFIKSNNIETLLVIGRNNGIIPIFVKAFTRKKLIYCEHNAIENNTLKYSFKAQLYRKLLQFLINRYADCVVTLTNDDLQYYKHLGVPCRQIYNAIDEKLLTPPKPYAANAKTIITCGRIDYQKGYEYLIAAAAKVLLTHPDWQWHIYGGGDEEYQKKLQAQIDELGLAERLIFMGTRSDIYDIYAQYSFYVMTSRWEGLPMVLLEAKAKGLPLVSFDIATGPSDIIRDGVDGYLVPPFDIDALAEKINFLIEHPEERMRLAANARGNLDKFSKEKIVEQWRELIDSL